MLLNDLWISGEVSNFITSQAGHAYFTLKDNQSQLRCVMFNIIRSTNLFSNGSSVTAHGRISYYEARGLVELNADMVMPEGEGALSLQYERLKSTLENEGLFDPSRKRALPRFPKTIGIVTSSTGAVFDDICNVLARRYPFVHVILASTPVQGVEASSGIKNALNALQDDGRAEVIILTRGGGSIEELWPFNEEIVARAIYACKTPIISAVGHERDNTIADYVADVRAPTASAAAEIIVPDKLVMYQETRILIENLSLATSRYLSERKHYVQSLIMRFHTEGQDIAIYRRRVDENLTRIFSALSHRISMFKNRLAVADLHLKTLSPKATLQRGYAIVENKESGKIIYKKSEAKSGDILHITVRDGSFLAKVNDTRKHD